MAAGPDKQGQDREEQAGPQKTPVDPGAHGGLSPQAGPGTGDPDPQTNQEEPDIFTQWERLSEAPGIRSCAIVGVEGDGEFKELPEQIAILDIRIPLGRTRSSAEVYRALKDKVGEFGGIILQTTWTSGREVRCHVILRTLKHAHNLAFQLNGQYRDSTFGAVVGPAGYLATHRGDILSHGGLFDDALAMQGLVTEQGGNIRMKHNDNVMAVRVMRNEIPITDEDIIDIPDQVTAQSIRHASTLEQSIPALTKKCVLIKAEIPNLGTEEQQRDLMKVLDSLKGKGVKVSLVGRQLHVVMGIESAPGNMLLRLKRAKSTIERMGVRACVAFGDVTVEALDEHAFALHSRLMSTVPIPSDPGLYVTSTFEEESTKPRNASIAKMELGRKISLGRGQYALRKIEGIDTVDYEVTVGGPRKMVGREAELRRVEEMLGTLTNPEKSQSRLLIVEGEAGIGKTRLACEAMGLARSKGVVSLYNKAIEDDRNVQGKYIKKFIIGILTQVPELAESFRDIEFYAQDFVPEEYKDEYERKVSAFADPSVLIPRFMELMTAASSSRKLQVILDDLHWLDDFSRKIIQKWLDEMDENSGTNVILMGRKEEQMSDELKELIRAKENIYAGTLTLERLQLVDPSGQPDLGLLREYVLHSLPEEWKVRNISDSFLTRLAEVSEGLPLLITEILSLLQTEMSCERGWLVVDDTAVLRLRTGDLNATIMSVIQEKFNRLSEGERAVVDCMIAVGNVSKEVFEVVLRFKFADEPERYAEALLDMETLRAKGIIRFTPFGFTHDLLRQQRERDLREREGGRLSLRANEVYNPLLFAATSHLESVTPAALFGVLDRALHDEMAISEEDRREGLKEEFQRMAEIAATFYLGKNDNLNAISVVETALGKPLWVSEGLKNKVQMTLEDRLIFGIKRAKEIRQRESEKREAAHMEMVARRDTAQFDEALSESTSRLFPRTEVRNRKTPDEFEAEATVESLANYLYTMYMIAAEAYIRIGDSESANRYLTKVEKLNELAPQARLLDKPEGLDFHVLRTRAAFADKNATGNEASLRTAQGTLRSFIEIFSIDSADHEAVVLASGELAIGDIRLERPNPQSVMRIRRTTIERLETARRAVDDQPNRGEYARKLDLLITEVNRIGTQILAYGKLISQGEIDTEAKFMQNLDPFSELSISLRIIGETLLDLKRTYDRHPHLVRESMSYASLCETLARVKYLLDEGCGEVDSPDSPKAILRAGLRRAIHGDLLEQTARLYKTEGDFGLYEVLRRMFIGDIRQEDQRILMEAIDSYGKGIGEAMKIRKKQESEARANTGTVAVPLHQYERLNTFTRALARALYINRAFGSSENNVSLESLLEDREEYQELIPQEWEELMVALKASKLSTRNKPVEGRQGYLVELATAGLLLEAANNLGVDIQIPQGESGIEISDIMSERSFLFDQQKKLEGTNTERAYGLAERGLVELRLSGIEFLRKKIVGEDRRDKMP
jgi:hypothetical protein